MCGLAAYCNIRAFPPDTAFKYIRVGVEGCGRKVSEREIHRAIAFGYGDPDVGGEDGSVASSWPDPNVTKVEDLVASYPTFNVQTLRGHASNQIASYGSSYSMIEKLFYPKALVCAGEDFFPAVTRSLENYRAVDPKKFQFIVANPMAKRSGKTKEGNDSVRCSDATGPRRWLVIECDFNKTNDAGEPTIWKPLIERWEAHGLTVHDAGARILRHLAKDPFPLAMVVDSGGKSLHGWFWVKDAPETPGSPLRAFMTEAAALGADTQLYTKCQWVRFPGGYRPKKQKVQEILYFRPDAIPVSNQEFYE